MDRIERNHARFCGRPWRRPHLSTWLFLVLPGTVVALAMIPGEPATVFDNSMCEHGWPCTWLSRQGFDGREPAPWTLTEDVAYLDCLGLAADLCVAALIMTLIAAAVEWRRRRRRRVLQFTVGDVLAVMLVASVPLKIVAERRAALERFRAVANGEEPTWETALPAWVPDWLYDSDVVCEAIFWLAAVRPDDERFDLPAVQPQLRAIRSLLDCGAQNIVVTVKNQQRSDNTTSDRFDPCALRSLVGLQHLVLERADDDVLDCLDSLSELRSLAFDDGCGPISRRGAVRLKGLSKLRVLRASRKCLGDDGIAAVASLNALEDLSLNGATDDDLVQLSGLSRLRFLSLFETSVTDAGLARLAPLSRLQRLQLSGYRICGAGMAPLASLPRLAVLDFRGSGVTDTGLAGLEQFTSLQLLYLSDTPITGSGLSHLAGFRELRQLDLSQTDIDDYGVAFLPTLPALEKLSLNFTRVTERGLSATYRSSKLKELSLKYTRVARFRDFKLKRLPELELLEFAGSRAGREELGRMLAARPSLEFARGRSCGLHAPGFAWQLAHAHELAAKDVRPIVIAAEGIDVGDRELASLCGLPRLNTLCLPLTRVTDHGLTALLEFYELATLDLSGAAISDAGLAHLANLPKLTALDLAYTDVTTAGLIRLADFPALQIVSLDPSQITDEVISGLKSIPGLKRLSVNGTRGLWGKKYRDARTFDALIGQLRSDLPQIDVSVKDDAFWAGERQGLNGCLTGNDKG